MNVPHVVTFYFGQWKVNIRLLFKIIGSNKFNNMFSIIKKFNLLIGTIHSNVVYIY